MGQFLFVKYVSKHLLSLSLIVSVVCIPAIARTEALPRLIGRFEKVADGFRFGWPGSAIEFAFNGTGLTIDMSDDGGNSFVVDTDGKTTRLDLKKGRHVYSLANGLAPGRHDIKIIRRTEGFLGPTLYHGASTDGSFLAVPELQRHILVIGDSITAGYGLEGTSASCSFSPDTENQYLTYAALASRAFDADLTTLAWSGYGLVQNFDGSRGETMASIWRRAVPTEPQAPAWNDGPYDVVIVNLGTNDFANVPVDSYFGAAYRNFLRRIREKYPQSFIYAAIGPMMQGSVLDAAFKTIETEVAKAKASGDSRIELLAFDGLQAGEFGCNRHPNAAAHRRMAAHLERAIEGDLNWVPH